MTLVSGNISCMRIFAGVAVASNETQVVDDGNFFRDLSGYFFGNIKDKASNII